MKFKKIVKEGEIASEAMKKKSRMHSKDAEKGWFGIKDAKFIYHGDWNDPEVEYKGVLLNYWDIESGLLEIYRDEHPEDKNDKGFDKWMADHPEEIRSELELFYDAEMEYRANNLEERCDEETYDDRVDREYKSAVGKYKAERKRVKDKIRDIVGDEDADDVFDYWDSIQSSFNMSWRQGGFYGNCHEHLDRLADILGPEGRDIIADIQRKFDQQAKELSEYYDTHDYTGD